MKCAIVTCLWKRPYLTEVIQDYYANEFSDCVLIAAKSEGDAQPVNDNWNYVYFPNSCLAQKFNKVFTAAKLFDVDAVLLIGSDDLISRDLFNYYQDNYSPDKEYMLGLRDLYYHDLISDSTIHSKDIYYRKQLLPIGCGRIFSKRLLNRIGWSPYGKLTISSGLDSNSTNYLERRGINNKTVSMQESGIAVDLKCGEGINSFEKVVSKYGEVETVDYDTLKIFHTTIERCKTISS